MKKGSMEWTMMTDLYKAYDRFLNLTTYSDQERFVCELEELQRKYKSVYLGKQFFELIGREILKKGSIELNEKKIAERKSRRG